MALVSKAFGDIITFTRASSATFTGSNGLIQSATTNTPRFDYDPVTLAAKGLLIEEQRTNLLLYSSDFGNAVWTKANITVTPNSTTAPDGTTSATTFAATTTSSAISYQDAIATSTTLVYTIYVKQNTGPTDANTFAVYNNTTVTNLSILTVNYSTGVVTHSLGSGATTTNVGNGWWRLSVPISSGVTVGNSVRIYPCFIGNAETAGESAFIWGAQLEAGAFATSYIPTVASQVTRSADVASVNTLSPWYNATEGTLYVEATPYGVLPDTRIATLDDGTSLNRHLIWGTLGSSSTRYEVITGGVTQVGLTVNGTFVANTTTKAAAAYKVNDFAFSVNGGAALTDTVGTLPSVTALRIGGSAGAPLFNGSIRRITYYPRRLSNAELQAITA